MVFIPIKPLVAKAWGASGNDAGHSTIPSRHRGRPPGTGCMGSI